MPPTNRAKRFIEDRPETLPFLRFLTAYREEWTAPDLARDYPRYREDNVSRLIAKLRDAELITCIRYTYVPALRKNRPLWKLTRAAHCLLDQ